MRLQLAILSASIMKKESGKRCRVGMPRNTKTRKGEYVAVQGRN